MYPALEGPAAAGDGIIGMGAESPVVLQALGSGAAPQGFPSAPLPWVISQGVAGGWGRQEGLKRPEKQQRGWWWAALAAAGWWAGNAASEIRLLNIVPGHDQRRQGPCTLLLARLLLFPPPLEL